MGRRSGIAAKPAAEPVADPQPLAVGLRWNRSTSKRSSCRCCRCCRCRRWWDPGDHSASKTSKTVPARPCSSLLPLVRGRQTWRRLQRPMRARHQPPVRERGRKPQILLRTSPARGVVGRARPGTAHGPDWTTHGPDFHLFCIGGLVPIAASAAVAAAGLSWRGRHGLRSTVEATATAAAAAAAAAAVVSAAAAATRAAAAGPGARLARGRRHGATRAADAGPEGRLVRGRRYDLSGHAPLPKHLRRGHALRAITQQKRNDDGVERACERQGW